MKLSIYTFVKDAIYYDFPIVEMLKHHLPFADEIIVNEGYSSDGTYEKIKELDPKIKIFRSYWDTSDRSGWHRKFKNETRVRCTGDWCILLDCDEFLPEWEFGPLRKYLTVTDKDILPLKYINFYGNYKVYNANPKKYNWPAKKYVIHRNLPDIEVWGDGSNVRFMKNNDKSRYAREASFTCHHFGFVRNPARLREKWRFQSLCFGKAKLKWLKLPSFFFDLFPHRWDDPYFINDLSIYKGPYIKVVRDNPYRFVRDNFLLYELLKRD